MAIPDPDPNPQLKHLDLPQLRIELARLVDEKAETCRLSYITPGYGKAFSYQEKLAEARLILDDPGNVSADLVPILALEAEIRGISIEEAANRVHARYLVVKTAEKQINATCILAKAAISDASDAAAAQAAYEAITWPQIP